MVAALDEPLSHEATDSGQFRISTWSAFLRGRVAVGAVVPVERGRKLALRLDWSNGFSAVAVERYQDLLPLLERGMSNVQIAAMLEPSESTVSRRVNLLLQVLGVARAALPLVARVLHQVPLPEPGGRWILIELEGPASWSLAELDVIYLGLLGLNVSRIQALRGTSTHTVRTQLRSAARKAGCVDRFEIAASENLRFSWRHWQGPAAAPGPHRLMSGGNEGLQALATEAR